jgi:hypothetical protein
MIQEPFEVPQFKNPSGLLGLFLIIVLSFMIPSWFGRKRNATYKKGKRNHPAVTLASAYFNIESILYGGGAVLGFMILLAISKE